MGAAGAFHRRTAHVPQNKFENRERRVPQMGPIAVCRRAAQKSCRGQKLCCSRNRVKPKSLVVVRSCVVAESRVMPKSGVVARSRVVAESRVVAKPAVAKMASGRPKSYSSKAITHGKSLDTASFLDHFALWSGQRDQTVSVWVSARTSEVLVRGYTSVQT